MRIGIDIDDTICDTTDIVHEKLEEYSKMIDLNPIDIMNDEELRLNFFNIYLEDIYTNVIAKKSSVDVIRRLHSKGNEIYLITARTNGIYNVEDITRKWLDKNGFIYDKLIISCYGITKARACKAYDIDVMIDDDPYNYKQITGFGINCLLFDDKAKYELKNNYVTSWFEVEKFIEGMI